MAMAADRQPRMEERREFTTPQRVRLLETDMDRNDGELSAMNARLGKILWAMIGILISTSTAALLLALNLGVHH